MYVNEKKELWLFFAAWYSPLEFVSVISRWKSRLDIWLPATILWHDKKLTSGAV